MKKIKKALRLFGFGLLLVLATLGVGLGGTPPVNLKRREDKKTATIELVEQTERATEKESKEIKT